MDITEETGKKLKVAAHAIAYFPKEFQVKDVIQRSLSLDGGPAPEWAVRLTLRCLEANGFYKHYRIDGRTTGWSCIFPDFLTGTGTFKINPVLHTMKLLLAWDVPSDRQKIKGHLAALPLVVQESEAAAVIAALDRTSHSMAIRNMPPRFRSTGKEIAAWIEQWKIRGLVYVDFTAKKGLEVIRKTDAWTPTAAAEAILNPATLIPLIKLPLHHSPPPAQEPPPAPSIQDAINREKQEAAFLAAIEHEKAEAAQLAELARLKAENAERRRALGL